MAGSQIYLNFGVMEQGAQETRKAAAELENSRAECYADFARLNPGTTGMGTGSSGVFTDMAADALGETVRSIGAETDANSQHHLNTGRALDTCVMRSGETVSRARTMLLR